MAFAFLDMPCRNTCSKHWAEKSGNSNHSVQASVGQRERKNAWRDTPRFRQLKKASLRMADLLLGSLSGLAKRGSTPQAVFGGGRKGRWWGGSGAERVSLEKVALAPPKCGLGGLGGLGAHRRSD